MDESQASDAQDLLFYSALKYPRLASTWKRFSLHCKMETKLNIYSAWCFIYKVKASQKQNFIIEIDVAEAVTHSRWKTRFSDLLFHLIKTVSI